MAREKVIITGASGMLGSALLNTVPARYEAFGPGRSEADITNLEQVRAAIAASSPRAVIHCAAYTDVDGCTRDPQRAHEVNAIGTRNVAVACHEADCALIALSTDYVFDGTKGSPYTESEEPNPINAYGRSKLAAEQYAQQEHDRVLIVRTQWLFGPGGANFVETIVKKARQSAQLDVVSDEYGSPTYTRHLAVRLWELLAGGASGIIHVVNGRVCSWAQLARFAVQAAGIEDVEVHPISRDEWESPTRRPRCSALATQRDIQLAAQPLAAWETAVEEYVQDHLV